MTELTVTGFRLSLQQEQAWLQQQRGTGAPARCRVRLRGPLDPSRLRAALERVIDRHEILRTTLHRQVGIKLPFQVICDQSCLAWAVDAQLQSDSNADTDSLIHARLECTGHDEHLLSLSMSTLLTDARGLELLVAELGRAYADPADDRDADDVLQYTDFVEWQQQLLDGEDTQAGRDFWRDYARSLDLNPGTDLPLGYKADSTGTVAYAATVIGCLEPAVCEQLLAVGASIAVSPANVLLACWSALLCRLTARPQIALGIELDGRKYEELETALGPFARVLPLQLRLSPDDSLDVLAKRLKTAIAEISNWEECFSWSQLEVQGVPAECRLPLQFSYRELPERVSHAGVSYEWLEQQVHAEGFELKLSAQRRGDRIELLWHYDGGRVARESVQRYAGYFQTLLIAALEDPARSVSRLPVLAAGERQRLLIEWNQSAREYPRQCLQELFEAQVARTPDRPAVRCAEQVLSYRELNERANQLAHHLRTLGVGAGSLVGLAVQRSAETMLAVLAILKAGGAYVPLSPDSPRARLEQQLSGVAVLLSEQSLLAQLPQFSGQRICLDRDQQLWAEHPRSNPPLLNTPEDLIYVIYTSGSTGVPKGVAVRHRNLTNYAHFITERLELTRFPEGLHFATVSTIGADLGNTCIFPALISGGCLHIIAYEDCTDAQRFARYAQRYPIDVLKIVPSHLQALLSSAEAQLLLPREYLIMGGEALNPPLLERIAALGPRCRILNHYGPTETTVGSLTLKLDQWQGSPGAGSIPIGRPIANTQIYILDAHREPVPIGVSGELYIAGAGVTAGYLNQPQLSAERFLANPFSPDAASRMYRTGDLARYGSDGNVEFLGRSDDQIKIRGFRIELGEIESVLMRHPAVQQALALAQEDERGEKRLLTYFVAAREQTVSIEALREHLRAQLPDYMMPAAIIALPKIPLTANGKIDRNALPSPEQLPHTAQVAPSTATEEVVAAIWSELLRRQNISTTDNFFELGGHSLMATQVISRIRRALAIELPLRTLFEFPTTASLAKQIEYTQRNAAGTLAPPITPMARDQNMPLSLAQQRLWVLDQLEPNSALYNVARVWRIHGPLDPDALEKALNEIVRRHESQRTTFAAHNGEPVQFIAASLTIALRLENLTGQSPSQREAEAERITAEEALRPFDLRAGPLVRARLLRLAASEHRLLLTMHHIISDAWSAAVLLQELGILYEAFRNQQPSPLPELKIQYADYAAWQRRWFQPQTLAHQLSFWREQLQGAPPLLELPSDRPRPKQRTYEGALETVAFSPGVTAALKELSRREGVTLFMTLLAGFNTLLARYSGQQQIVIGTDVANRPTVETEKLIGFFVNLLVLRTDLSGNPAFRELLSRVRATALAAYAHQDMPFDKLVEELRPERTLSHNPIVQVLFVMQNIPRARMQGLSIELCAVDMPVTRSKFDLGVFMVDKDDRLTGHWVYSTDLFDRARIVRMAAHFETLLQAAVTAPETRIATLSIHTEAEKEQRQTATRQRKESQRTSLLALDPTAFSFSAIDPGSEGS